MGYSSQQSLYPPLDSKGAVLQNKGMLMLKPLNKGSLWCKVTKSHANMRRQRRRICIRRMSMKRSSSRAVTAGATTTSSKRSINGVERRIRTLKKLVPNGNGGGGIDGLLGETADYIKCLQMKVKIMQMMINLLSSPSD